MSIIILQDSLKSNRMSIRIFGLSVEIRLTLLARKNAGLNAAWVDRAGLGWRDGLIEDGASTVSSQRLDDLVVQIEEHIKKN